MKIANYLIVLGLLCSCNGANFSSGGGKNRGASDPPAPKPTTPGTTTGPTIPGPATQPPSTIADEKKVCTKVDRKLGARVALLIDNSSSNAATDCARPRVIGSADGVNLYQCDGESHREQAALRAFDLLKVAGEAESAPKSMLNIAGFPGPRNSTSTAKPWIDASKGWLIADSDENRVKTASALQFVRTPHGQTPYDQGIAAAGSIFGEVPAGDKMGKLAILITDGEPTDRDPVATASKAAELHAQGVTIATVFVTGPQSRDERMESHRQMLAGFDSQQQAINGKHWWTNPSLFDFDSYFSKLIGSTQQLSLVQNISSLVDSSCKDAANAPCARRIYELANSAQLEQAVTGIVKAYQEETCN